MAPSGVWAQMKMTLCMKRGSRIAGMAMSNWPVSQSALLMFCFNAVMAPV